MSAPQRVGTAYRPLPKDAEPGDASKPTWKQEIRDKEGRRRFHGAFTGGFSAGYFNTVGTKEGWAPQGFSSSRVRRGESRQMRPEDFMDEDDDPMMGRQLRTREGFTGADASARERRTDAAKHAAAAGSAIPGPVPEELVAPVGTIGKKLLQRMGWREGHGVGPRQVRCRPARTSRWDKSGAARGAGEGGAAEGGGDDDPYAHGHVFAPENTEVFDVVPKVDRYGLGFDPVRNAPEFAAYRFSGSRPQELALAARGGRSSEPRDVIRMGSIMGGGAGGDRGRGGGGSGGTGGGPRFRLGGLETTEDIDVMGGADDPSRYDSVLGATAEESAPAHVRRALEEGGDRQARLTAGGENGEGTRMLPDPNAPRCVDGRLPLPGFTLTARTRPPDLGRRYRPPQPPRHWRPRPPIRGAWFEACAAYGGANDPAALARAGKKATAEQRRAALGERPLPARSAAEAATATARERARQQQSRQQQSRQQQAEKAQEARRGLSSMLAKRFATEGSAEAAASAPAGDGGVTVTGEEEDPLGGAVGLVHISAQRLDELEAQKQRERERAREEEAARRLTRPVETRELVWRPTRLLCKRLDVPDPYERAAPPADMPVAAASTATVHPAARRETKPQAPSGTAPGAARGTGTGASEGEALEQALKPTLERPADRLFASVFGDGDSDSDEEEEEEEEAEGKKEEEEEEAEGKKEEEEEGRAHGTRPGPRPPVPSASQRPGAGDSRASPRRSHHIADEGGLEALPDAMVLLEQEVPIAEAQLADREPQTAGPPGSRWAAPASRSHAAPPAAAPPVQRAPAPAPVPRVPDTPPRAAGRDVDDAAAAFFRRYGTGAPPASAAAAPAQARPLAQSSSDSDSSESNRGRRRRRDTSRKRSGRSKSRGSRRKEGRSGSRKKKEKRDKKVKKERKEKRRRK